MAKWFMPVAAMFLPIPIGKLPDKLRILMWEEIHVLPKT